MKVLDYVLSETIKKRNFQTNSPKLLTNFYTVRWVNRLDKEELMTYYAFLLDSLEKSGDLALTQPHGYALAPQALNTISAFEQEERRHHDNHMTQRGIFFLTIVLMAVGIVQAYTSVYDAWYKP